MPANIMMTMMTKLTAPSGCWRANSSTALCERDVSAGAGAVGTSIAMASVVPDARVEHGVEQVDHEIDHHIDRGQQHDHALDQRKVVVGHALHEQLADPVEVEHLLGDHQPADQERKLDADHGDRR